MWFICKIASQGSSNISFMWAYILFNYMKSKHKYAFKNTTMHRKYKYFTSVMAFNGLTGRGRFCLKDVRQAFYGVFI